VGIFEQRESEVRSYCRKWPAVFDRASGSWLYDEHGRPYLDFFAGASALNYGHNNPVLKQALLGTIAVEAALKLARKVTGRTEVACFTNGFHGMTLGSLAVTGNGFARHGAGLPLAHTTPLPYDQAPGGENRARAGSTSRPPPGCAGWPNAASGTASC